MDSIDHFGRGLRAAQASTRIAALVASATPPATWMPRYLPVPGSCSLSGCSAHPSKRFRLRRSSWTSTSSSATSPRWPPVRATPACACGRTPRPTSARRSAPAARGGRGGISLAKIGEAEVFAVGGFDDIFLAYPIVGADKGRRLLRSRRRCPPRRRRGQRRGRAHAGGALPAGGPPLEVLLKVDCGYDRVGVVPEKGGRGRAADRGRARDAPARYLHARRARLRAAGAGRGRGRGDAARASAGGDGRGLARRRTGCRRGVGRLDAHRAPWRCARRGSRSAGRATTSSTMRHRCRSEPAGSTTAR